MTSRRLLASTALAVGIVAASTGTASAQSHSPYHPDTVAPEPCGIECVQPGQQYAGDQGPYAPGITDLGIPAIFVIGLAFLL